MSEIIVNLTGVNYTYFDRPVLTGLSWEVQAGQRIGLVGANGGGKSTLLRLILGRLAPEGGAIFRKRELTIGYLPQEVGSDPEMDMAASALETVLSGSPEIARLRHGLTEREAQLADPSVYSDPVKLARVLEAHEKLLHAYEAAGGLTFENRARSTLRDLGLDAATFDQPLATLSGGQAKLAVLGRLLVWGPDLLLLDEPDNHLDVAGKETLEKLIRGYPGTVVIVSHDRYLLDQVVDRIAELERGQVSVWPGTYSVYATNKQLALMRQEQMYRAQQKRIVQIEAAIARWELAAKTLQDERAARQARSRHKMLERMDKIERPGEQARMRLELGGWRGSHKVLEARGLEKGFADERTGEVKVVLSGLDLLVWHGERVGLVGPNGAGKSVLFRCILDAAGLDGEPPDGGVLKLGPSVRIGYYAQQHETLNPNWTLIEAVRDVKPMYENDAVAFLARFLFDYLAAQKQVRHLSGGERSRLQLARLMLSDVNFLLLDEPTNNLDIPSSEVLEGALESFGGTVLVISHDRYFLDRIVDRVVGLEEGRLVEVVGGYSDYLAAQERNGTRKAADARGDARIKE